jgi:hypothetical protein
MNPKFKKHTTLNTTESQIQETLIWFVDSQLPCMMWGPLSHIACRISGSSELISGIFRGMVDQTSSQIEGQRGLVFGLRAPCVGGGLLLLGERVQALTMTILIEAKINHKMAPNWLKSRSTGE